MEKEVKGFIAGMIVSAILVATAFSSIAAPVKRTITAVYDNIKIYVDGNLIQPEDSNGKKIEPFTYNGTTYLPVKAVSQALGKNVTWDSKNKSVYIGPKPEYIIPAASGQQKEITVDNIDDFVKAIASNTKIILKPKVYDLSKASSKSSNDLKVYWKEVSDGKELWVNSVENLTIEGYGGNPVELVTGPRYAEVIHFKNCNSITLKNIKAGHTVISKEYLCNAGVIGVEYSQNMTISNCILYGCGSQGIHAWYVNGLKMDNSVIEKCNQRVMSIYNSNNFTFKNCKFRECEYMDMIDILSSNFIVYDNCEFRDNRVEWENDTLISCSESSQVVKFTNSSFVNNRAFKLYNPEAHIEFKGCTFEGNTFDKD